MNRLGRRIGRISEQYAREGSFRHNYAREGEFLDQESVKRSVRTSTHNNTPRDHSRPEVMTNENK